MKYLDEMLNKGWLIKSDNLLTKEEKRYFSYYMDNGEFTNGHAYRNLYAHGCIISEDDTNKHHIAYLVIFLRLLNLSLNFENLRMILTMCDKSSSHRYSVTYKLKIKLLK